MVYPPFVYYRTQKEYRDHFERVYCTGPIVTFDKILVRFRKSNFDHCFFESSRRDGTKDKFSKQRAERIDWIKTALQDPSSERFFGWNKIKKRYDKRRRVAIVKGNYVVVIQMTGKATAKFITAFVADVKAAPGKESTIEKIKKGPRFPPK